MKFYTIDEAREPVDRVQIYQGLLDRSKEIGATTGIGVNEFVLNSDNKRFDARAATTRLVRELILDRNMAGRTSDSFWQLRRYLQRI